MNYIFWSPFCLLLSVFGNLCGRCAGGPRPGSAGAGRHKRGRAASQDATETRGRADADAVSIYAGAFGKDKEFYQFSRTLESYDKFIDDGTTLILPSDSELLRYLDPRSVLQPPPSTGSSNLADAEADTGRINVPGVRP